MKLRVDSVAYMNNLKNILSYSLRIFEHVKWMAKTI